MTVPAGERRVVEAERRVLQALCQGTSWDSLLAAAKKHLADYRWHDPVHQVIFECRLRFARDRGLPLRDYLPGCVTRKGFPDLDWEEFFKPVSCSRSEIESLMRELRASE
jgi:hypothetical protein